MSDLRIPPEHQQGLSKLFSLSEQQASDFLAALKSVGRKADRDTLSISDLPEISGVPRKEVRGILDTVVSLYGVRADAEVPLEEFVSDICDSLRSSESKEFQLPEMSVGRMRERLTDYLSIDFLNRAAKAVLLRYEHERTFCDLRVLTDARPVFGNDTSKPPEAMVIFHMLKIAFHEANRVSEVFFSLDENDLVKLKKAVVRAEAKANSLKKALAAAHIKVISPN